MSSDVMFVNSSALGIKLQQDLQSKNGNYETGFKRILDVLEYLSELNSTKFIELSNNEKFMRKQGEEVGRNLSILLSIQGKIIFDCSIASKFFHSKKVLQQLKAISKTIEADYKLNKFGAVFRYVTDDPYNPNSYVVGIMRKKSFRLWKKGLIKINDKHSKNYVWLGQTSYDEKDLKYLFKLCINEVKELQKIYAQVKVMMINLSGDKHPETILNKNESAKAFKTLDLERVYE